MSLRAFNVATLADIGMKTGHETAQKRLAEEKSHCIECPVSEEAIFQIGTVRQMQNYDPLRFRIKQSVTETYCKECQYHS